MKEGLFLKKNLEKWKVISQMVRKDKKIDPLTIAQAYEEVSADLAFAQTNYPMSDIIPFLNSLALNLHTSIYGSEKKEWTRLITFWTKDVPLEVYRCRKMMYVSLAIFLLSTLLGILSTVFIPEYAKYIMGEDYINMTLKNIENGVPMNVYSTTGQTSMFVSITLNNIMVALRTFVSGIFTCFSTGMMLLYNGTMVGTFMTFCQQHGVLLECLLAMWLHGVIEITSIVIAGGAGLTLGKGWLFPGTYPRMTSFKMAAKSGVKVAIGLIPCFIIAGFVESFCTRHTEWPIILRLGIIILSIAFVALYFIYLPKKVGQNGKS